MNKATHIVLIDAAFETAFETANSIKGYSFLNADEAMEEIKRRIGTSGLKLEVANIYELENFRINVNNGSDILTDVFICFINIIE